ncbi:nucleoside monophosphate kinase [Streptacidiphilus sp. EB103A]|uniref:nucleoside monophosphate kinase n=1 Tax=Streptacidiphilus sp. EB103A TaxID=3156275 RepID=UPI00351660BB
MRADICAPTLVALIGPTGSGKSTAVQHLSAAHHLPVLSLRDLARQRAATDEAFAELLAAEGGPDSLTDPQATVLVAGALLDPDRWGGQPTALLDGYPASAVQTAHLVQVLRQRFGAGLAVIELRLDNLTARDRVRGLWVCSTCEPSPDPHLPAHPGPGGYDRCARCGARLLQRRGDLLASVDERLARFRQRVPLIRRVLHEHEVPLHVVGAQQSPQDVARAVDHAFARATAGIGIPATP